MAYFPFAFFNLINPILSFIFDAIGFQIQYLTDEKAAAAYPPEPEQVAQYGVGGYNVSQVVGAPAEK